MWAQPRMIAHFQLFGSQLARETSYFCDAVSAHVAAFTLQLQLASLLLHFNLVTMFHI